MKASENQINDRKLTRGRKKKSTKVNESLEDFVDKKDSFPKTKTDESLKLNFDSKSELHLILSSTRIDNQSNSDCISASILPCRPDQLPPCPLCGKNFVDGQELAR